ncbi:hypothetical protein GUITHDRAFT_138058 [Guillardia theta CCMP2712]|uniref:WW domain-containing protein n=2 Tax=Guillardia theta TaxID=55529 RepID=L1JDR9_GUITC|nr:hypothetical protein GUITHDRAFT_138058 [Guillardia theta CCMP2712]EKX46683.1 hypothetical protein GUITHDRAFT_138058 [Guillardia theta CCMP2712]|eukprot:XP_005833663.1 hypothetical protein GUITHDRAFT_138058 [Guillardia theta CCMP2712]
MACCIVRNLRLSAKNETRMSRMRSLILVATLLWCSSTEISCRECLRVWGTSGLRLRGGQEHGPAPRELTSYEELQQLVQQAERFQEIEKMETELQAGGNETDLIHEIHDDNQRENETLTEEMPEEDVTAYDIKTLKRIIEEGDISVLDGQNATSDINATNSTETNASSMQKYSEILDLKEYLKDVEEARQIVRGLIQHRSEAEEKLKVLEEILNRKQLKANQMLWDCACTGDIAGIEKCVELGANVSAGNPELFGRNALHMAAYHGKTESVRALLGLGSSINSTSVPLRWTALHYAAQRGHKETVEVLLEAGSDPERENDMGKTPSKLARLNGYRRGFLFKSTVSLAHAGLSDRNSTLQAYVELDQERKLQQAIADPQPGVHPGSVLEPRDAGNGQNQTAGFDVSDMMPDKLPDFDTSKISEALSNITKPSPPRRKPPPPPMKPATFAQATAARAQAPEGFDDLVKSPEEAKKSSTPLVPQPPTTPRPAGLPPKPASIPQHVFSALQSDTVAASQVNPTGQAVAPPGQAGAPAGQPAAPPGQTAAAPAGQAAAPAGQAAAPAGQSITAMAGKPTAAADIDDLPLGWKSALDYRSGRTYFYNKDLGLTQWEKPAKPQPAAEPPVPSKAGDAKKGGRGLFSWFSSSATEGKQAKAAPTQSSGGAVPKDATQQLPAPDRVERVEAFVPRGQQNVAPCPPPKDAPKLPPAMAPPVQLNDDTNQGTLRPRPPPFPYNPKPPT